MREFYKAVIGQKSRNYYLEKFEAFDKQGIGLKPSWNWSALFGTGVWALYRKMYGWFFAWCGVVSLSSIFEKSGSPVVSGLIGLISLIVFSAYANSLYHNKIKTKIAVAQLTFKDDSSLLEYLNRKGGVHKWVVWVFGGIPIIGIVAAFVSLMVVNKLKQVESPVEKRTTTPTITSQTETPVEIQEKPLALEGIRLGDNLSDFLFKNEGFEKYEKSKQPSSIMEFRKGKQLTVYIKEKQVDAVLYYCTEGGYSSLDGISCNASEDDIFKRFDGKKKVRCIANMESNGSVRAYEVLEKSVRYILQHNKVTGMQLISDQSSWAHSKVWEQC